MSERDVSLVITALAAASEITRSESHSGTWFQGTREALIAAGVAKPEWLPTDEIAFVRKDGVAVRKRSVKTVSNGRRIESHYLGRSNEAWILIGRTDAEQKAWLVKHEADEKLRLDRERGIDAEKRHRLDAEQQARQDASDARKTAAEWLDGFAHRSEVMVSVTLGMLTEGRVKRITPDAHERLVRMAAQFHHAVRNAEVYTVGADQAAPTRRALRLVVDNEPHALA